MYSIVPENPVFQLFWGLIPSPYWYMFLVFPIVAVYLLLIYVSQLKALLKKKVTA